MSDNFYNHRIIAMERAETSGNGQSGKKWPMWKCRLEGGKTVNAFQHEKSDRNSYAYFHEYHAEIDVMEIGDVLTFNRYPIECRCVPDGQWLKLVTVAPRPEGARPDSDEDMSAEQTLARAGVAAWAKFFLEQDALILDLETDDKTTNSEILSIAIVSTGGETIFQSLVKPTKPGFVNKAEHINGITAEMLADAPTLAEIYERLYTSLAVEMVAVYNEAFDIAVLQNALIRAGQRPIPMLATVCVMKQFAMYRGQWNPVKQDWRWATLSEAVGAFNISVSDAHNALADCRMTLKLIECMSIELPLSEEFPF